MAVTRRTVRGGWLRGTYVCHPDQQAAETEKLGKKAVVYPPSRQVLRQIARLVARS